MPKSIGSWIRDARTEANLSQQALAEKLGVYQPQVCNWENDRGQPDREVIERIAGITGAEIDPTILVDLGEWLLSKRDALHLTRRELAKRAGISSLTIYFIETGRTLSPQEATLRALERVLGKLPGNVTEELDETRGEGNFEYLGPFPIDGWQESIEQGTISCIYVVYDSLKRPVRIGQTDDLRRRMKEYAQYWWFKAPLAETFAYVKIKDPDFRSKAEKVMIKLVGDHAIFNKLERI